jgi:hypothetical protein
VLRHGRRHQADTRERPFDLNRSLTYSSDGRKRFAPSGKGVRAGLFCRDDEGSSDPKRDNVSARRTVFMNKCRVIMWGAPLFVGLVVVAFYWIDHQEARTITLANYRRIMVGMTTEEVEAILGRGQEHDPSTKRTYSLAMSNRIYTGKEPLPEKYLVWHRRGGGVIEIGFKEGKVLTTGTNLNHYLYE